MNLSEFFAMGGHGFYIWWSYGVTVLLIAIESYLVVKGKRSMFKRLARMERLKKVEK